MTHAKKQVSVSFMLMGILFCICLVAANLLETKVFKLWGPVSLTCGFIVFPVSYILNDVIAEVWGYRKARLIIWVGFAMNFFVMALAGVACALPPIEPGSDEAFKKIFAFAPQIVVASLIAFIIGSFLNALVMSKMKMADRNKGHFNFHFSMRAILSTLAGESADSFIFFPLAFYIFPTIFTGEPALPFNVMIGLMVTQVIAKTLYEVLVLPITIRIVKYVKRIEGTDVYDDNISYSAFKIRDL
ncbi:MAG: queuosine precursor transporter [Bacteroidales bacterium]|nr:queuosine precursor transporter [Bacteroidales bacterium]